jgi:hypothetical protein
MQYLNLLAIVTAPVTATTTTATATVLTTSARRAFFPGLRYVDGYAAATQIRAIHSGDGFLRFFACAHGDEGEAAWPIGHPVHHQIRLGYSAVNGKGVIEIVFRGVEGKISYK